MLARPLARPTATDSMSLPMRRSRAGGFAIALSALIAVGAAPYAEADLIVPANSSTTLSAGTLDLACTDLVVAGTLRVATGRVINVRNVSIRPGGTIDVGSGTIALGGNWSNSGTFGWRRRYRTLPGSLFSGFRDDFRQQRVCDGEFRLGNRKNLCARRRHDAVHDGRARDRRHGRSANCVSQQRARAGCEPQPVGGWNPADRPRRRHRRLGHRAMACPWADQCRWGRQCEAVVRGSRWVQFADADPGVRGRGAGRPVYRVGGVRRSRAAPTQATRCC